ncbi:MAG TPA: 3-phosphoshikimate 1-carboxyvinyltransferase, partial [Muricauda sp.]|nr:3-phosphoshikimate 1-carboxyvinyltransferase [Allomuricauda sp.]
KFGAKVDIDSESLTLTAQPQLTSGVEVDTYNDHRMAMAFGPLALKTDFVVNDAEVVSKSYPDFWNDLVTLGFGVKEM